MLEAAAGPPAAAAALASVWRFVGHGCPMRLLVTGATGNLGSQVVSALARDDAVESVVSARPLPRDATGIGQRP